jgi:TRAP-type C4-dicarboxylate transport system permease large subunit
MNRKTKIALLSALLVFTVLAVAFCALLIQNHRWQFDMQMSYAEMTRHVRSAFIALVLLTIIGGVSSWRLVRLVRGSRSSTASRN